MLFDADKVAGIGREVRRQGLVRPVRDIGSRKIETDILGARKTRRALVVGEVVLQGAVNGTAFPVQLRVTRSLVGDHDVLGIAVETDQDENLGGGAGEVHVPYLFRTVGIDLPPFDLPVHQEVLVEDTVLIVDGDVVGAVSGIRGGVILVEMYLCRRQRFQLREVRNSLPGGGMGVVRRRIDVVLLAGHKAFAGPVIGNQIFDLLHAHPGGSLREMVLLEPGGRLGIALPPHENVQAAEIVLPQVVPGGDLVVFHDIGVLLVLRLCHGLLQQTRQNLQPLTKRRLRDDLFPDTGLSPCENRKEKHDI